MMTCDGCDNRLPSSCFEGGLCDLCRSRDRIDAENEKLREKYNALRKAVDQMAREFDNEADVDDGQPNAAMRALVVIREALSRSE
jgi:hypothetical protein